MTRRRKSGISGGLCRAGVIAAALYLALVQVLSAAHAASVDAGSPNHNAATCVFCLTAHGTGHGLVAGEVRAPAPTVSFTASAAPVRRALAPVRIDAPEPRGPPSV